MWGFKEWGAKIKEEECMNVVDHLFSQDCVVVLWVWGVVCDVILEVIEI